MAHSFTQSHKTGIFVFDKIAPKRLYYLPTVFGKRYADAGKGRIIISGVKNTILYSRHHQKNQITYQ
jgi:hypothetical protein